MIEKKIAGAYLAAKTESFDSLIIEGDAVISTEAGKAVTLLVGGVEKPVAAGEYKNAVLAVSDEFVTPVDNYDTKGLRAALYVDEKGIDEAKSVTAALSGGKLDSKTLSGAKIKSEAPLFTGVVVAGGKYDIKDLSVEMTGHGGNDFSGYGTGLVICGDAKVEVDGYKIENHGLIRNAVVVGGTAEAVIKNASITCYGVSDQQAEIDGAGVKGMKGVPWVLGLSGNNRATNVVGKGKVTYIDSTIKAERWGVLSTDGVDAPKQWGDFTVTLTTKNCDVELFGESGYGSYSIGACKNTFDNTHIKVPDYALVCANEYAGGAFINGTVVDSNRFGVMWHQNQGGLLEVKNATFNCGMSPFSIKSCYPKIEVENSVLNAKNGIILQMIDSDDPGLAGSEVEVDTEVAEKWADHDLTKANFHEVGVFSFTQPKYCTDVQASFKDMSLVGDFYNSTTNAISVGMGAMPEMPPMGAHGPDGPGGPGGPGGPDGPMGPGGPGGPDDGDHHHGMPMMPPPDPKTMHPTNMVLTFVNVDYTGVISSSVGKHNVKKVSKANRIELGQVNHTPAPAINNGAVAYFDEKSKWTVTGKCYLNGLYIKPGAKVEAPAGKTLSMTVNGKAADVKAGDFAGEIVIEVK